MSSIFGIGVPKFTGTGSPDSTTRILYYSILDPKFSEKIYKVFDSPVSASGKRTIKTRGRYATFYVTVKLYLYDSNPHRIESLPNAKTFANTLLSYEDKDVVFYPFKDGSADGDGNGKPIKNASAESVTCRLLDLDFDFVDKVGGSFDVVTLTFITNEFWSLGSIIQ